MLIALRPSPATLTLPAADSAWRKHVLRAPDDHHSPTARHPDGTLVLGQILGALVFGALAAPFAWVHPSPLELGGLFLLGIVSMAGMLCVNRSLKLAPASIVAPYQYTLIIWAIVLGYLAFGDIVEFWTLVGAGMICAAGLILLVLERAPPAAVAWRRTSKSQFCPRPELSLSVNGRT